MPDPLHGSTGFITLPGATVQPLLLFAWTLDVTRVIHDITSYDLATINTIASEEVDKEKLGGMTTATGTASGWADAGTTPILTELITADSLGVSGFKLVLRDLSTDAEYSFKAIISSMDIGVEKVGLMTFACGFTVSGAITETPGVDA